MKFAEHYYESTIPVDAVRHVYNHLPLTDHHVSLLNADIAIKDLTQDLAEIGYPDKSAT